MHPLPYSLNVVKGQGCLGVGCLSLRTFYLRAGITSDVSATPHLHGGPVHIFSTRRVDFDDFFAYLYYLSLFSALRPCCLSLLPVFSPCPLPLSAFHALVAVLPRLSACFFHFLAWFCCIIRCTAGSTTHTHEGLKIFDETWLLSFE